MDFYWKKPLDFSDSKEANEIIKEIREDNERYDEITIHKRLVTKHEKLITKLNRIKPEELTVYEKKRIKTAENKLKQSKNATKVLKSCKFVVGYPVYIPQIK